MMTKQETLQEIRKLHNAFKLLNRLLDNIIAKNLQ